MKMPPIPENEAQRLQALYEYHILDTGEEEDFNDLVKLASEICGTSIALINLIETDRTWFKAKIGTSDTGSTRELAFCSYAILENEIFEIPDTTLDERFAENPLVTHEPDIRFYAGIPLHSADGYNIGTLCVLDQKVQKLSDFQLFALSVLGNQVMSQLEIRKRNAQFQDLLQKFNQHNQYLQQFSSNQSRMLSIVSHDLRNPISGLKGLVSLLEQKALSPDEITSLASMLDASLSSVETLCNNLISWASKQFNQDEPVYKVIDLHKLAEEIIKLHQFAILHKQNRIINETGTAQVLADEDMLKFIFRNLIVNANKFTKNGIIRVTAQIKENEVEISVSDTGEGMTSEHVSNLFNWDKKQSTTGTSGERGSGLGLLLCQDFVSKQGGTLKAESELGKGSRFYFSLPKAEAP